MKRMMAALLLASASTVAQAQWTGQARMVDSYTWGTPVPQQQRHLRPRPAYSNPQTGAFYQPVGGGYINTQTGQFMPAN
ncbi:hypothetical protein PI86_09170 [Burkholderia sp. A9]|uniref:hypothetical protein n=1 Tax=Burkholderia sp. A9 TaxID=1365108 RepID=UPI0005753537|nr:hypothetical protein [Burkholderia sp. A9]KHK59483.1 hypothetical protein PI86_09170 [Burkholderia sp. A9]